MEYDHSKNAGNQADLVKHVALVAALEHLLGVHPEGRPFLYGDLHCGRPKYVLREHGGWRDGVHLFAQHPRVVEARQRSPATSVMHAPILRKFDSLLGGHPFSAGSIYLGSAGIAFRMLRDSTLTFEMHLWESNRFIADDLIRYFDPWAAFVRIDCGNGYGFDASKPFSLILIDPVELEVEATLRAMERMTQHGIPFLSWMPRRSLELPTRSGGSPQWGEAHDSEHFPNHAARYGTCLRVQWAPWGGMTPGCYLTVSPSISEVSSSAIRAMCSTLGWACAQT